MARFGYTSLLKESSVTLKGISIGTDILLFGQKNSVHQEIWKSNIEELQSNNIPYSVTITFANNIPQIESLLKNLDKIDANPDFFYIRGPRDIMEDLLNGSNDHRLKYIVSKLRIYNNYYEILDDKPMQNSFI